MKNICTENWSRVCDNKISSCQKPGYQLLIKIQKLIYNNTPSPTVHLMFNK